MFLSLGAVRYVWPCFVASIGSFFKFNVVSEDHCDFELVSRLLSILRFAVADDPRFGVLVQGGLSRPTLK